MRRRFRFRKPEVTSVLFFICIKFQVLVGFTTTNFVYAELNKFKKNFVKENLAYLGKNTVIAIRNLRNIRNVTFKV